jgi:chromosome segregation ATPase
MANKKKNKKIKNVLLIILAVLSIYSLVMWYFNYKTLNQTVKVVEQVAEDQSKNFRFYVQEYKETKVELDVAKDKIVTLTAELEAANAELLNTRQELSTLQGLNDELKGTISSLENYKAKAMAKGEALENMIVAFKKKNKQLDADLQSVRKELATFQPDISDSKEGRAKIQLFKNHIVMVKKNMNVLKQQALTVKIEAQKQRDRLEMLYGNNGYMVKDGQDQSLKRQAAKVDIKVEFK